MDATERLEKCRLVGIQFGVFRSRVFSAAVVVVCVGLRRV